MKLAHVSASYPTLDPCLLGRPIHLLGNYTAALRDEFAEHFRVKMNRRYRAAFEVGEARFERGVQPSPGVRWRRYANGVGTIGFAIDRPLLLSILEYRYGNAAAAPLATDAAESASEERLAALLGHQFVERVVATMGRLPGLEASPPPGGLSDSASAPRAMHDWMLCVNVTEARTRVSGALYFALDAAWMHLVLQGVGPMREQSRTASPTASLGALGLNLHARLLDTELPLGTVLDIRVGDILPIRLESAAVFVGDGMLFRAMVAEHRGKLCLTAFEDVD